MARRIKLTVFSRFLIVMLFLGPLAYMGASYYNGEDGLANLKQLLGIKDAPAALEEQTGDVVSLSPETGTAGSNAEVLRLEQENLELKKQLLAKEEEILQLKKEIATLKANE